MEALDFETFDLIRQRPMSYQDYTRMQQSNNTDQQLQMNHAMALFKAYVEQNIVRAEVKHRMSLRPREFNSSRNIASYI